MCVCVCVCVYLQRERKNDRDRNMDKPSPPCSRTCLYELIYKDVGMLVLLSLIFLATNQSQWVKLILEECAPSKMQRVNHFKLKLALQFASIALHYKMICHNSNRFSLKKTVSFIVPQSTNKIKLNNAMSSPLRSAMENCPEYTKFIYLFYKALGSVW